MARTRGGIIRKPGNRRPIGGNSSDEDIIPLSPVGYSGASGDEESQDSQPESGDSGMEPPTDDVSVAAHTLLSLRKCDGRDWDEAESTNAVRWRLDGGIPSKEAQKLGWDVFPPQLEEKPPQKRRECKKDPLIWEILQQENRLWVDEYEKKTGQDLEQRPPVEVVEPSPDVTLPLLRYQKEWLAWALKQEESNARGGILADEMGMGKTIQAISLVLTARNLRQGVIDDCSVASYSTSSSGSSLPRIKCTLVVCPVIALKQWGGEIERHTEKGSTKVLLYHGARRASVAHEFNDYDFVLTTYATIEGECRKQMMQKCQRCSKKLMPRAIIAHLRFGCKPHAEETEEQSKKLENKDTSSNAEGSSVSIGGEDEGAGMMMGQHESVDNDVNSSLGKSVLHSVHWERIILDEAHFIKSSNRKTAKAIFSLESSYKWALSGTPMQNRVGELYSLVRFLQINPYAFYFCVDCDCKILDYDCSLENQCVNCGHRLYRSHFCWWKKYITKPIYSKAHMDVGRRAMILLKEKILKNLVLRRTKKDIAADLALPPRSVSLRRDMLDIKELEFYEALFTQSVTQFDTYVAAGTLMNNYAHICGLLTQLRQAVNHPYLVIYSKSVGMVSERKEDNAICFCGICHGRVEEPMVPDCRHVFCKACLVNLTLGGVSCPLCFKPVTVDLSTRRRLEEKSSKTNVKGFKRSSILNKLNIEEYKGSTKIDALREEIRNMLEADVSAKGIVFSQYISFLDLINYSLQMSGIKCVQLVGSTSLRERERAIATFTEDAGCKIFLMSLKAGGVALNLTVASHVFLMDPWWNPALESQAQDRIHRIGQYKPVRTLRFVIGGTVEERILKLQEKKKMVFEQTVGESLEALAQLTEADLRFLFKG